MAQDAARRSLEEIAESGRLGRRRFLKVLVVAFLLLFLVGWGVFTWYFSSETFQQHVDSLLRPRLMDRGVQFDEVEVSPLGEIRVTNMRIRLPNGEELVIPEIRGYTQLGALVKGEARVTLDVSELAQKYFEKAHKGIRITDASKILYISLSTNVLAPGKDVRGDLHLEGVALSVAPPQLKGGSFPLHFQDGTMSLLGDVLTAKDLHFSLPSIQSGFEAGEGKDLDLTFDGNVRSLFSAPEFTASKVSTNIRTEPMWSRALGLLNLEEVTRKIRWFGPLDVQAELEGPIFTPEVRGKINSDDLFLRMQGEFRQINIRFTKLRGPITLEGQENWSVNLVGGRVDVEYFRLKEKELKHLYAHAQALQTKAVYNNRVLTLEDLVFAAYDGKAFGKLRWDLNDRRIRLGEGRYGDTAYEYHLGLDKIDVGGFLTDITSLHRPLEGKLSGLLRGKGRTLMLERMAGTGRFQVQDLRLGEPPRKDLLTEVLGPQAVSLLPGIPLGNLAAEWTFQIGQLQVPRFEVESAQASLDGGINYQILTLDIDGVTRFLLKPGVGKRLEPLQQALGGPGGGISAAFGGRVVSPDIRYRVVRGAGASAP